MHRLVFFALVAGFHLLLATPFPTHAQHGTDPRDGLTFRVTSVSAAFDQDRTLHRAAMAALEDALRGRGARTAEHPFWTFAVAVRQLEHDAGRVALSVVATASFPESVVNWARESQVFYVGMAEDGVDALPAEGRAVREYLSEDYIRQYGMLQEHDIVVVDRDDLAGGASTLVDRFYRRHFQD